MAFVDMEMEEPLMMEDPPEDLMGAEDFDEEESEGRDPNAPGVSMEELGSLIKSAVDDAVDYSETELAAQRLAEQQYYDGEELPGDENLDGTRSKVISRDVHDTVKAILPSLLRIFFSGKSCVEYEPIGPEDEEFAAQATDYVNEIVLKKDNNALTMFYDIFWDALTKALGPVMWWWQDNYEVVGQTYTGLTEEEFNLVTQDPQVTDVEVYEQYQEPTLGMVLVDCHVSYKILQGGKVKLAAVPPEERLINKGARTIDDSTLYGRRRTLTVSEVVAMGYDYAQVVTMGGSEMMDTNEEASDRQGGFDTVSTPSSPDPSLRTLEYVDAYIRVDVDGDGFAELYHIACGGTNRELLRYADTGEEAMELVEEIPYAEFCPDPIPHLATGNSIASAVMDIQRIKSNLLRATLDSLSRSIFPREEVVSNQVNMDDVLNPEIGAVIRVKQPGMIREVATSFMGREALPVLGYMDEVKKNRTGINDATQGLDPGSLQSTSAMGVSAAVAASQVQIEMIARLFAMNGMARLFRGLLKLIKTHQDKVRTVRLRNTWVPVDPSYWNADMDATINTALGMGTDTEKLAALAKIAEKQEMVIQQAGPNNPLCTMAEYRHTLAKMVEIAGYPNADQFFLPVTHQQVMQQMQQEKEQMTQQLQEAQQQLGQLQWELQKHTEAEDATKLAKAFKDRASGVGDLVDAAVSASEQNVAPGAAADEIRATTPFLN